MSGDARLIDEAAERAVLGAILVRNTSLDEIADLLTVEHFGVDNHAAIYGAMARLHAKGTAIDFVTLGNELRATGNYTLEQMRYVTALADDPIAPRHVGHYARLVVDKALLRRIRREVRRILAAVEDEGAQGTAVLEQAEAAIYGIGATATKSDWLSTSDIAGELRPIVQELAEHHTAVTGLHTGFTELDMLTRGLQDGDLVLLGARPSQGKTALANQVALRAASGAAVAFFSIEMSRQGIGLRQVIALADVNGFRMLSGRLSEIDLRRVGDGLARLEELTLWLDESPTLSPLHVRSKLRRLKARVGRIGLVVIDYLQLMEPLPDHRRENKTNQVAGISRALKVLAREFGAPFLVLSQLNRGPADGSAPTMSDLRDSGALEQDADVVLLLHRPEVYDPTPENAGLAEVIIGKQRNGPTGKVELTWRPEPMRFENRART
jgi:replicative DNA helicase